MVLRRWAMVMTVQSENCSRMDCWMMPSVLREEEGEEPVCHAYGSKVTFPFHIFISLPFELSSYLHQPHSYHLLATAIPSPTHSLEVNVGSGLVQH